MHWLHEWSSYVVPYLTQGLVILGQLVVALLCGGLIGYQREKLVRPAGLRTHVLVCVGSAIYMLVSIAVADHGRYDPGRIAAQVASGMGFLGAGTIIKQGNFVRGLTTAASLWTVSAVGLAVGLGGAAMGIALVGTVVVYWALSALRRFELHIEHGHAFNLEVTMTDARQRVDWLHEALTTAGMELSELTFTSEDDHLATISLDGFAPTTEDLQQVATRLLGAPGVKSVQWTFR